MADFAAVDTLTDTQLNFPAQKDVKFGASLQYYIRFQTNGVLSFAGMPGVTTLIIDPDGTLGDGFQVWDSDYSHKYQIGAGNIGGNYKLQLPVITADDLFLSNDCIANIKNKTLYGTGWRVVAKSADATLASDELVVMVSASGANRTMTLPASSTNSGRIYIVQKSDSSANTVTIDANASETINGSLTFVLTAQYQSVMIYCDGTNWFTQPNTSERTGTATGTANGSNTVFNIAHGLGSTPYRALIACSSHSNSFTYATDSTNIVVTFGTAPSSSPSTATFHWSAVL